MQVYQAQQAQQHIKPAFTVKKLEGTVDHVIHAFDKKENKIKKKTVQEPAGYLVKFAKGHSIRCRDIEQLRAIGVGYNLVPLVDTNTGDIVGALDNIDDILDAAAEV